MSELREWHFLKLPAEVPAMRTVGKAFRGMQK